MSNNGYSGPAGPPRYRECPYCRIKTFRHDQAIQHARACAPEDPAYLMVWKLLVAAPPRKEKP